MDIDSLREGYVIEGEIPALVDEKSGGDVYLGYPKNTGSATGDAEWGIQKISKTSATDTLWGLRLWAGKSRKKVNVWDDRASLTYGRML